MSVEFCDTNVLVYAFDTSAGEKRAKAQHLLERLVLSGDGAISVQVLQELFTTWDAMIVLAAQKLNADVVWSEDLNDGQAYGSTVVRNPFRAVG
ncbi:MAG: hypothetical protein HY689_16625 [Chloroflexi bacterium]|nr:hypothetical protein [Chloroflexota bacterium]